MTEKFVKYSIEGIDADGNVRTDTAMAHVVDDRALKMHLYSRRITAMLSKCEQAIEMAKASLIKLQGGRCR